MRGEKVKSEKRGERGNKREGMKGEGRKKW